MKKVLAGGRFNVIHPGHVYFLKQAKARGDYLVVVVASDRTIRTDGKSLLFPQEDRRKMVASLKFVDKAVIGYEIDSEQGYMRILKKEKPHIIALGYDQRVDVKRLRKIARAAGLFPLIRRIGNFKGYQTKKIIKRKQQKR